MLIFGQQTAPRQLELDHTFATFVQATGKGPDKSKYAIASHTISWMPRSLGVKFLKLPVEGVCLDLKDTLRLAKTVKAEVAMWGAFPIKKELFERALRQEVRLKSGAIDYKALDILFRPNLATNCVHSVCDIDTDRGLLATGAASGPDASLLVLTHLSRWIINDEEAHDWIGRRLELGNDIVRREFRSKPAADLKK